MLQPIQVTSVFYVNLLLGCLLTAILLVTARPIASILSREPTLAPVLQVVALGLPVNALTQVQRVLLMKELRFRKISIAQIISSLAGGVTGIIMACRGMGVWALVGSLLVFQLVTLVIFWMRSDWYPQLHLFLFLH